MSKCPKHCVITSFFFKKQIIPYKCQGPNINLWTHAMDSLEMLELLNSLTELLGRYSLCLILYYQMDKISILDEVDFFLKTFKICSNHHDVLKTTNLDPFICAHVLRVPKFLCFHNQNGNVSILT